MHRKKRTCHPTDKQRDSAISSHGNHHPAAKLRHSVLYTSPNTSLSDRSDEDIDRRNQLHYLLKHYFYGNFNAPVEAILQSTSVVTHASNIKNNDVCILDVNCGTGTWVLEMAFDYPNVQCFGIDPKKAYPSTIKPPNAHFSQYNVALGDTMSDFKDNSMDFVRMQMIYKSYTKDHWKMMAKEMNRVLKRGGYFELRDVDPIMKHTGPIGQEFFQQYPQMMGSLLGIDVDWYSHMCEYMERYGKMTDIHYQEIKIPVGWAEGDASLIMANLMYKIAKSGLESHRKQWMEMTPFEFKSLEAYTHLIRLVLDEAVDYHGYYNFYLCWGRKPLLSLSSESDNFNSLKERRLEVDDIADTHVLDADSHRSTTTSDCESDICALAQGYEE